MANATKKEGHLSSDDLALVAKCEAKLNYEFKDKSLLLKALTHRSFVKEEASLNRNDQNERLEFLGDAVLSMVAAQALYLEFPQADEGTLTQLRASYVCQNNLAEAAKKIALGSHLRVAKAMRSSGSIELPSVLSDVLEAIFGAAFLDAGLEEAQKLVLSVLGPLPRKLISTPKDPKTELQELIQSLSGLTPMYVVTSHLGPAHSPVFVVEVSLYEKTIAQGQGPSKKEAAQAAAKAALEKLAGLERALVLKTLGIP